jgi:hypothetical protein
VGARGRGAGCTDRKPHKNRRPGPASRAAKIDLEFGTAPYWDLVLNDGRYWPNEFDPVRRHCWFAIRDKLYARWPFSCKHGKRLGGWWSFEAPALFDKALAEGRFTEKQAETMDDEELVYWLDAGPDEKASIESGWAHRVRYDYGLDAVPQWFQDRVNPRAQHARLRRRRA